MGKMIIRSGVAGRIPAWRSPEWRRSGTDRPKFSSWTPTALVIEGRRLVRGRRQSPAGSGIESAAGIERRFCALFANGNQLDGRPTWHTALQGGRTASSRTAPWTPIRSVFTFSATDFQLPQAGPDGGFFNGAAWRRRRRLGCAWRQAFGGPRHAAPPDPLRDQHRQPRSLTPNGWLGPRWW